MSNLVFNIALGMINYYASSPQPNDGLIMVPLEGVPGGDNFIRDYMNLAGLLDFAAVEQTSMGRLTLSGVGLATDNDFNLKRATLTPDPVFVAATGNPVVALLICYVPDLGVSPDSDIIPMTKHDFNVTPAGVDIPVQILAGGFWQSSNMS